MKKKKIIFWRHKITGIVGHGQPSDADVADAWAEYGNNEYPNIFHVAVDVGITKMHGCFEVKK